MSKISNKKIIYLAMFIALEIVFSRFLSINAWNIKIGLNFIPIVLAALLFGPIESGIVGAIGDFLGAILFPIGAYFPGFTLTAFLTGLCFGLFLKKVPNTIKTIICVFINQFLLSLLLNTLWISVLYGSPFNAVLVSRIPQCIILFIVEIVVIIIMIRILPRVKNAMKL